MQHMFHIVFLSRVACIACDRISAPAPAPHPVFFNWWDMVTLVTQSLVSLVAGMPLASIYHLFLCLSPFANVNGARFGFQSKELSKVSSCKGLYSSTVEDCVFL